MIIGERRKDFERTMAVSPRMQRALERVEARRVELERAIVAEMEAQFTETLPIGEHTEYLGASEQHDETRTSCPFTTIWFA